MRHAPPGPAATDFSGRMPRNTLSPLAKRRNLVRESFGPLRHNMGSPPGLKLRSAMNKRMNQRGFTLMELMVVIVIVAILAAVAVPLYINYVKDARRTEAKGAIAAVISAEQIYYQTNPIPEYTSDMTKLKFDPAEVQ